VYHNIKPGSSVTKKNFITLTPCACHGNAPTVQCQSLFRAGRPPSLSSGPSGSPSQAPRARVGCSPSGTPFPGCTPGLSRPDSLSLGSPCLWDTRGPGPDVIKLFTAAKCFFCLEILKLCTYEK